VLSNCIGNVMFQSSFIAYPVYPMRFVEWKKSKEKYHSLIYIFF